MPTLYVLKQFFQTGHELARKSPGMLGSVRCALEFEV
jgi:hypothetical protein